MDVVIKTNNPNKIAKDCLDAHLYVKGWLLVKDLEAIYYFSKQDWDRLKLKPIDIAAAYVDNVVVGVMTLSDTRFNTFVKGNFRRKGLGSLLYKEIIKITDRDYKNIQMINGSKGSKEFFDSIGHPKINVSIEQLNSIPRYIQW